jgi:hypothetical protein
MIFWSFALGTFLILLAISTFWLIRYRSNWKLRAEEILAEIELGTSTMSINEKDVPRIGIRLIKLNSLLIYILQKTFKTKMSIKHILESYPEYFHEDVVASIFWAHEICRLVADKKLPSVHDQQVAEACEIFERECERVLSLDVEA